MPKASELAAELRKFADCLDSNPDVEVGNCGIYSSHYQKNTFLNMARLLPRPWKKSVTHYGSEPEVKLTYISEGLTIMTSVPQSLTCTLVEPAREAVYHCDPILSMEEDAELESA